MKRIGVEEIGIHDNFFQLGGDSILAAQLISQVNERMHVELSLLGMFEEPTVAEMALLIEDIIIEEVEKLTEDEARRLAESSLLKR
jgi:acyl carrier protein